MAQNEGCEGCRHYSALREPRQRSDGATIHGYCFKHGDKNYSWNMGKGFAVFQPLGACKDRKNLPRKRKSEIQEETASEQGIL